MSLIELEQFIELGYYKQLNSLTKHADVLKNLIKDDLEAQNIQRYVWEEYNVVGKFRNVRRYKYDHYGLKEYLHNLGILPVASTIKTELLLEEERLILKTLVDKDKDQILNKVRFYPKSMSRGDTPNLIIEQSINNICIPDCIYLWREYRRLIDKLTIQWNTILAAIDSCFNEEEHYQVKTQYGSLEIKKNQLYSSIDVLKFLGEDVLIRCSHINLEKLNEFAVRGFISKSEINKHRQIINIDRQFLLMELDAEERMDIWLKRRQERLMLINISEL